MILQLHWKLSGRTQKCHWISASFPVHKTPDEIGCGFSEISDEKRNENHGWKKLSVCCFALPKSRTSRNFPDLSHVFSHVFPHAFFHTFCNMLFHLRSMTNSQDFHKHFLQIHRFVTNIYDKFPEFPHVSHVLSHVLSDVLSHVLSHVLSNVLSFAVPEQDAGGNIKDCEKNEGRNPLFSLWGSGEVRIRRCWRA